MMTQVALGTKGSIRVGFLEEVIHKLKSEV